MSWRSFIIKSPGGRNVLHAIKVGRGSSVAIATDYGLDGPGSNPGGHEIFRLGPTQPPVK